jgi:membrane protease YdiL (CAAX protease family)
LGKSRFVGYWACAFSFAESVPPLLGFAFVFLVFFLANNGVGRVRSTEFWQSRFEYEGVAYPAFFLPFHTLDILRTLLVIAALWFVKRNRADFFLAKGQMKSGRGNIIVTILLLLFPIILALTMNKLSVVIVSTVVWQFVFSGFGEEFVWRGYVQSRLNQAFGRPMRMFGVQFGWGLLLTSLLFGLLHAFNTYDPAIGFAALSWGSALASAFAGVMFGVIREKTGTLLAPGIARGLPDAVGEGLAKIFGWTL